MNKIVFTFVFVAVGMITLFTALILIRNKTFVDIFYYKTVLDDARGLEKKPAIFFKGYEIGRIDEFDLNDDNQIDVNFYIYEDYTDKILTYSVISKTSSPVSGEVTEFELVTPVEDSLDFPDVLPPGSMIPYINSPEGQIAVRKGKISILKDDFTGIIVKLNEILAGLVDKNSQSDGAIFKTLQNLDGLTQNLESVTGDLVENNTTVKVDQAMLNVAEISKRLIKTVEYVNRTLASMDTTINAYRNTDGIIEKMGGTAFTKILQNADTTMTYVKNTLKQVNDSRAEINMILYNLNQTLKTMEQVLKAINENPFIGGAPVQRGRKIGVETDD